MKRLFTIFSILITSVMIAQNAIEKNVGDFKTLKVYDLIQVELIKSDTNKIVISGENAENVVVNNKNGTLKIKMEFAKIYDGNNTHVTLYYTTIDAIDANEGSKIASKEEIKQFEIDLKAKEGSTINLHVNVNYINVKAVTGGIIEVTGIAKKESISLLTGGAFKGEKLQSEHSDVSIHAAGEAAINASKIVDIKIRAGGDVFIYGKPETVNENKILGGRVKMMD